MEGRPLAGIDHAECFRAALVLAVSSLDHYLHSLVVESVMEMAQGVRLASAKFSEIKVSFASAQTNLASGSIAWLGPELREQNSHLTFQRPDKISAALKIIDPRPHLWTRLAAHVDANTKEQMCARLDLIVDRRNMIAHEADVDPTWGTVRPLTAAEVESVFAFLKTLVDSIESECW